MEAIKNDQLNRPLPDLNYVRPKLPSITFSKAERFVKNKKYEGPTFLFKDGIFEPKTQKDFFIKEPFSGMAQRTYLGNMSGKTPSPAEYKIKSTFEIIAEKGKKISENRKRIQMKDKLEKENIKKSKESLNNSNSNINNKKINDTDKNNEFEFDNKEEDENNQENNGKE